MKQCVAMTRKGARCGIGVDPGSQWCHVHNPEGTYAQQHLGKTRPLRVYTEPVAPDVEELSLF